MNKRICDKCDVFRCELRVNEAAKKVDVITFNDIADGDMEAYTRLMEKHDYTIEKRDRIFVRLDEEGNASRKPYDISGFSPEGNCHYLAEQTVWTLNFGEDGGWK